MQNPKLYIHYPMQNTSEINHAETKTEPIRKAKRNEVPAEYRTNLKEKALDLALMTAICVGAIMCLVFFLTL